MKRRRGECEACGKRCKIGEPYCPKCAEALRDRRGEVDREAPDEWYEVWDEIREEFE